jgi:tetratricopeptide (TPR) repeat protein
LGTDHPYTLESMQHVAESLLVLGRKDEALKVAEESLALHRSKLGSGHLDTIQSMLTLAEVYSALNRNAEAVKLGEEGLAYRKSKLGPDHPRTLQAMNYLATFYAAVGRYADSLKLLEETLALQKAKLGPNHRATVITIYNIACGNALLIPKVSDGHKQAELAMDWLNQAVAGGFKDVAQIKKDTDLDALRGRDDFKKLVAELEAKVTKQKK